jgi:hypothetical protein
MDAPVAQQFKIADQDWEFDQIHRLNYRTFVEEIPQHAANSSRVLVDRFHKENTYIICLRADQLVGMIAVRGARPFSLDEKLEHLDSYLPVGRSVCEIRLLAVDREHRSGQVFWGLGQRLVEHCKRQKYDLAIISGTVRQHKLYKHLGFVPFGPLVGTSEASFQPMYISLEAFEDRAKELLRSSG